MFPSETSCGVPAAGVDDTVALADDAPVNGTANAITPAASTAARRARARLPVKPPNRKCNDNLTPDVKETGRLDRPTPNTHYGAAASEIWGINLPPGGIL